MNNSLRTQLEQFFLAKPEARLPCYESLATQITTPEDLLLAIQIGLETLTEETFDATTGLVSYCGQVAIDTLLHPSLEKLDSRTYEDILERLVTGIYLSYIILSVEKRFETILNIYTKSHSRITKCTIIDGIVYLVDESFEFLKSLNFLQEIFLQDSDKYVRDYAKEAIKDVERKMIYGTGY